MKIRITKREFIELAQQNYCYLSPISSHDDTDAMPEFIEINIDLENV